MSFLKQEALENKKGWTAAAVVVGAGVVGYVAYKYYKDTLKGGKSEQAEAQNGAIEEVTFKGTPKQQRDSTLSSTFDKLEDLSKDLLKKDSDINESFIVLPSELPSAADASKHLEQVGEKISEGAKTVGHKLEEYKEEASKNIDAGVKAVNQSIEGYSEDLSKGVKEVNQQIDQAHKDLEEKVQEGVKQAAVAVEDFKSTTHDKINDVATHTSEALHEVTEEAHKKLEEGAADVTKNL